MDIRVKTVVSGVLFLLGSKEIFAAESGKSSYPPGGSMYFIGEYPPVPGNYLQSLTYYGTANRVNDHKGNKTENLNFDLSVVSESLRFVTAWDSHLLKADAVASELILTYASVRNSLDMPNGRMTSTADGLGDIVIAPLAFQWNLGEKKNWQTAATIYYVIPSNSYSKQKALNISNNHYSIQPTFGVKYRSESGFSAGISPRVSLNWKNEDTKYKNGTEFFADYMFSYKVGNWEPGIVGYYSTQFENDEMDGVKIKNSKTEGFSIGPAIYYNHANKVFISGSFQKDLMAKNKSQNNSLFLSVAFPY
ncbi:SphA family protein [Acinetobacter stercoris]|uniref:Phenol degradation protein meta n=1 Tax=Acinetobacter stercoris TaxID=2126983 RepID=A0A2U3N199_9GAMM|nr:transporter [Acinetobacter stercoris]SPL71329.1 hypothetical protein KPC_2507 [Acinetobacter stercoris]